MALVNRLTKLAMMVDASPRCCAKLISYSDGNCTGVGGGGGGGIGFQSHSGAIRTPGDLHLQACLDIHANVVRDKVAQNECR